MSYIGLCGPRFQEHAALFRSAKFGIFAKLGQGKAWACIGDRRSGGAADCVRSGLAGSFGPIESVWELFGEI